MSRVLALAFFLPSFFLAFAAVTVFLRDLFADPAPAPMLRCHSNGCGRPAGGLDERGWPECRDCADEVGRVKA